MKKVFFSILLALALVTLTACGLITHNIIDGDETVIDQPVEESEETPVKEPEQTSVEEPEETPVEEPEDTPVEEPEETPVKEPEQTPTEEPEQTSVEEPEQTPAEEPEQTPVKEPEETPVEEPEQTPVEEPEQTPDEPLDHYKYWALQTAYNNAAKTASIEDDIVACEDILTLYRKLEDLDSCRRVIVPLLKLSKVYEERGQFADALRCYKMYRDAYLYIVTGIPTKTVPSL